MRMRKGEKNSSDRMNVSLSPYTILLPGTKYQDIRAARKSNQAAVT